MGPPPDFRQYIEALDNLIESIKTKPMPAAQQAEVNELIDHVSNRTWNSAESELNLNGLGADGIVNDAYSAMGIEMAELPTTMNFAARNLLEAAQRANVEEFKSPEAEPFEVAEDAVGAGNYDEMLEEPLLGDPEAREANPNLYEAEPFQNVVNRQLAEEMMQQTMIDFLGMVPIGQGGLLPFPEDMDEKKKRLAMAQADADFQNNRYKRLQAARDTWVGQDVYVNIGNEWFKAHVKDMYNSTMSNPTTKFDVEVEWDDLDGKTMEYVVPAKLDRIRMQTDGPPPLREGGVLRYEPFTNPEDVFARRSIKDILETEQVNVEGTWREVRRTYENDKGQTVLKFSDGTEYISPHDSLQWRARGRIHTRDNPKQPKWDPKAAWHAGLQERDPGYRPKSGPKGQLKTNWERAIDEYAENETIKTDGGMTDEEYQKYLINFFGGPAEETPEEEPEEEPDDLDDKPVVDPADPAAPDQDWGFQDPGDSFLDPWVTPTLDDNQGVNANTGHVQEDVFPGTAESMRHTVETGGFHALEKELGLSMPEIYENYALGNFDWQHDRVVPEWLQPNLSKLHGGTEKYAALIDKYSSNYEMMRNLERVDCGQSPGCTKLPRCCAQ